MHFLIIIHVVLRGREISSDVNLHHWTAIIFVFVTLENYVKTERMIMMNNLNRKENDWLVRYLDR